MAKFPRNPAKEWRPRTNGVLGTVGEVEKEPAIEDDDEETDEYCKGCASHFKECECGDEEEE